MKRKRIACIVCVAVALCAALAALVWAGVFWPNNLLARAYPVRGVDVSAYQGEIDWPVLAGQGLDFAFIKATEGSSTVDERFEANWRGAESAKLRRGAYHFFSFDSPGTSQAENFISTVPRTEGMLPPVVDVELYGRHRQSPPEPGRVRAELRALLEALEARYGVKPILYTLEKPYSLYLAGEFSDYDLWIRAVLGRPKASGWTFWQYSPRGRLRGYRGEERYIDLDVFCGSAEDFEAYGLWPK